MTAPRLKSAVMSPVRWRSTTRWCIAGYLVWILSPRAPPPPPPAPPPPPPTTVVDVTGWSFTPPFYVFSPALDLLRPGTTNGFAPLGRLM